MTTTYAPTTFAPKTGGVRTMVGYAAILGTLPYLALKAAWLSGSTIGVLDRSMLDGTSMVVLNTVTAGMDLVAIVVALAFTHSWGLRVPAWLVLVPIWVGTGLLAPIALAMPIAGVGAVVAAGGEDAATTTTAFLEPWVQPMVYSGFAWQGVMLIVAFVLYARTRWAEVFTARTADVVRGATHSVQVVLAGGAAVLAFAVAALHLARAFGGTVGLSADAIAARTWSAYVVEGISGLMALAAAVGILALVHRRGRGRFWVPLTVTWLGAGALFAWGLWGTVNILAGSALVRGADPQPIAHLHDLAKVLAGLVIGLTALMVLAEQRDRSAAGLARRPVI
jgi:hypothetical protein